MKKKCFKMLVSLCSVLIMVILVGCGETSTDQNTTEVAEEESVEQEAEKGFFDASYTAETAISYSAGNDSDWRYGNQRKEFPNNEKCYVRIASKAITDKGKGVDNAIEVTYRFTGVETCKVNLSDGIAEMVETDDPNVLEFTRTIYAKKSKKRRKILLFSNMFQRLKQKE